MSQKTCFVIAPIGEPETETRKRSDKLLKHIIAPTVRKCGYADAIRADALEQPGIITKQVLKHIVSDDLVIADLSGHNPNVFYELALRHAIKKPLVQMIQKPETLPFDVAMMRTVRFDIPDLDNVEQIKADLEKQIRHFEQNPDDVDSPISETLNIETLKGSPKTQERALGELLSTITEMFTVLLDIQRRVSPPERPYLPNETVGVPTVYASPAPVRSEVLKVVAAMAPPKEAAPHPAPVETKRGTTRKTKEG
ncbi:MAG TPA: hypothetical protein VK673_12100 [Chthoniobacterales bacterium]|nr:hypothetical protein [Chthoniobacterales bacterium]